MNTGTTLATPYALGMLLGLVLIFFALRGFDTKYNVFGGALSGIGTAGGPATGSTGPIDVSGNTTGGTT